VQDAGAESDTMRRDRGKRHGRKTSIRRVAYWRSSATKSVRAARSAERLGGLVTTTGPNGPARTAGVAPTPSAG